MTVDLSAPSTQAGLPGRATWKASPFLHVGPDRVYNPVTDQSLLDGQPGYSVLRRLMSGEAVAETVPPATLGLLERAGWLVRSDEDPTDRFLLKYVSLEAHSVCNQACYFCPVSVAPRESHFMPTEQYEDILRQLSAYKETIEAVFMISYNEPTVDKRFVDQVAAIRAAGLAPATLTNGTGLTPERIDRLVELGGLRFLSINLSTVDRGRYTEDRGRDHLEKVLVNVDYAADREVGEQMDIVVLGTGDAAHDENFEAIQARYADSRFNVKSFVVNDRAGYLQIGLKAPKDRKQLCGCDYMGSRPLQHLHITPEGRCILCCQDYDEQWIVGDLNESTVDEVLTGPKMRQARRWVYGMEEAPDNFICRSCRYALVR